MDSDWVSIDGDYWPDRSDYQKAGINVASICVPGPSSQSDLINN